MTDGGRFSALVWQACLLVSLLALWQLGALYFSSPQLPRLQMIFNSYLSMFRKDVFLVTIAPSMYRLIVGFFAGVIAGALIGLTIGYLRALTPWVRPILEYLRFIPPVVLLPAALMLLGPTDLMRISIIAFSCMFPVLLAAVDGARRVDPLLLDVGRIKGLSAPERIVRIIAPAALPSIFAGVRIALGFALIMMVISELIAADNGLGYYILRSQRLFQAHNVYAGILVIGTMGWVLTTILLAFENRILGWHKGWRGLSTNKQTY